MVQQTPSHQHPSKQMPSNIEAEQVLLGLLLSSDALSVIGDQLASEDFYRHQHRLIYEAMQELSQRGESPDVVTVSDIVSQKHGSDEQNVFDYLDKLVNRTFEMFLTPTSDLVMKYAMMVKDKALSRRILDANAKIAQLAMTEEAHETLTQAESMFMALSQSIVKTDFVPLDTIMRETLERVKALRSQDRKMVGLSTGFTDLDRILRGLRGERLYIVAGRPGMGKSSFALTIAYNVARYERKTVGILSLEMGKDELAERLVAIDAHLDSQKISTGDLNEEEWLKFDESARRLTGFPVYIDDTFGCSIMDLKSKARRLQATHGIDLLIVDYLQLMHADKDELNANELRELAIIGRGLKELARELNIPVIALAQLNRKVEERAIKVPQLSDLRGSGTIEQDSDVVMFLYREEEYINDSQRQGEADVIIAKHRGGPKGTVALGFNASQTWFYTPYKDREVY